MHNSVCTPPSRGDRRRVSRRFFFVSGGSGRRKRRAGTASHPLPSRPEVLAAGSVSPAESAAGQSASLPASRLTAFTGPVKAQCEGSVSGPPDSSSRPCVSCAATLPEHLLLSPHSGRRLPARVRVAQAPPGGGPVRAPPPPRRACALAAPFPSCVPPPPPQPPARAACSLGPRVLLVGHLQASPPPPGGGGRPASTASREEVPAALTRSPAEERRGREGVRRLRRAGAGTAGARGLPR